MKINSIPSKRLVFGTSGLHKIPREKDRIALLHCAYDVGFRHFDLASCYGGGIANEAFRKAFKKRPTGIAVSSKIGLISGVGASKSSLEYWLKRALKPRSPALLALNPVVAAFREALDKERRSVERERLDYVFFHEPYLRFVGCEGFVDWISAEINNSFLNFGVAGDSSSIIDWVRWSSSQPFNIVTQTKDSIEFKEADFLLDLGRQRDFTYGYVRGNGRSRGIPFSLAETLSINKTGKVIYATTSIRRLKDLDLE